MSTYLGAYVRRYVRAYSNGDCMNSEKYNLRLTGTKAPLKEDFSSRACSTCRCFSARLSYQRSLIDYGAQSSLQRADCYDTLCARNETTGAVVLLVHAGRRWLTCPRDGGVPAELDSSLFRELVCPAADELCPDDVVAAHRPVIARVESDQGPAAGGRAVTLIGENFHSVGAWGVSVLGVPAADLRVRSRTELVLTPGVFGLAGAAELTGAVTVTDGFGRSATRERAFTYVRDWPELGSIEPAEGPLDGGNVVTITGRFFSGRTWLVINGRNCTGNTLVSPTLMVAVAPSEPTGIFKRTAVSVEIYTQPYDRSALRIRAYEYVPSFAETVSNFLNVQWWIVPVLILVSVMLGCFVLNRILISRFGPFKAEGFLHLPAENAIAEPAPLNIPHENS